MKKVIIELFEWLLNWTAYFTIGIVVFTMIAKETELAKTYAMISSPFWLSMIYFEIKKR